MGDKWMVFWKRLLERLLFQGRASADAAARNRLRQRCGHAACGLENSAENKDSKTH